MLRSTTAYVIKPSRSLAEVVLIIGKVNEMIAKVLFTCRGPRSNDEVVLSKKSGYAYTCVPFVDAPELPTPPLWL